MCRTHRQQLHRYWNWYFFTQVGIDFLGDDETDYGDDTDHKCADVCLWKEVANLQNGLEKVTGGKKEAVSGSAAMCLICRNVILQ